MVPEPLSFVTVLGVWFATQIYFPSNAMPPAAALAPPTEKVQVPTHAPVFATIFVTVPSSAFDTQTFAPSNATAIGATPTVKVPSIVPSLARILLTLPGVPLMLALPAQRFAPSNASPWTYGLPDGPAA